MFNIKKKKREDDLSFLERAYTAILKKKPDSFLNLPLAFVHCRKGNLEKAINTLQKSISTHPNYVSAKYYLALFYQQNGEIDKAVELFKKVAFDSPDNYAAHKALMEHYLEQEDEENAMKEFDEIARLESYNELIPKKIDQSQQITAPLSSLNKKELKEGDISKEAVKEKEIVKTSSNGTPQGLSDRGKKIAHINNIRESEKAGEQLKIKRDEKEVQKLPCATINNDVKKNKAKEKVICSLEGWLKNIDKASN